MNTVRSNGKSNGDGGDSSHLSLDAADQFVFQAAAVDADWQQQTRDHATAIAQRGSAKRLSVLQAEESLLQDELQVLKPEYDAARALLDKTPNELPNHKRRVKLPGGWAGLMTIVRVLVVVLVALSEWWNAAGFPARGEMQSYTQAAACTFIFVATFFIVPARPEKEAVYRLIARISWAVFVVVFTACFVVEGSFEAAARAVVAGGSGNLWRWLLLPAQITASTYTGAVLIICIAKALIVIDDTPIINPRFVDLRARVEELWGKIKSVRLRLGEVQGEMKQITKAEDAYVRDRVQFAKTNRARAQYLNEISENSTRKTDHEN